jgi:endonuclease G
VAYELFAKRLLSVTERNNRFTQDPQVKPPTCLSADYTKSGYDRGHLVPAADMLWDEDAMKESFYMSNISPQVPGFNRGIWKVLEEKVRDKARSGSHLFICAGPLLGDTLKRHIGVRNAVTIPDYFFKAIVDTVGIDRGIAFIIPNQSSKSSLSTFAVTIDYLEAILSRDLFPALDDEIEMKIERVIGFKNF